MTYELVKKLKDAGFILQEELGDYDHHRSPHLQIDGKEFYIPTLPELIEACGEITLKKTRDALCEGEKVETFVYEAYTDEKSCLGATPEEAVANLWLALNQNDPRNEKKN